MPSTPDTTLVELQRLLDDKCYQSAELLGSLLLSTAKSERKDDRNNFVRVTVLYADALIGLENKRRARWHLEQAIAVVQEASEFTTEMIHELLYKSARLSRALDDPIAAQKSLEGIPVDERTAGMHMLYGDLCQFTYPGMNRGVDSYKRAVLANPYCINAYISLVKGGMSITEVRTLIPAGAKDAVWPAVSPLLEGHAIMSTHDYKRAAGKFEEVSRLYPSNTHVLLNLARCHVQTRSMDPAQKVFEKICSLDKYQVSSMDTYASVLRAKGSTGQLNILVQRLIENNPNSAEAWVAAAIYADLRGDTTASSDYIERALRIDPRHEVGHLAKGALALQMSQVEVAVEAFREARHIHESLDAFEGLVEAYLVPNPPQYKNALCVAKEALQQMPRNARALTLVGRVLSYNPEGHTKAHKAFRNALALDPDSAATITGLVDLLVMQDKNDEAIAMLQQQIQKTSNEVLHVKLGDALTRAESYHEALAHYHIALSLDERSQAARLGLSRCERVMKGLDPDPPHSESDGELGEYMLE